MPYPTNHAPVIGRLTADYVMEHAIDHYIIGVVQAKDEDGDPLTYELIDDAGGRFYLTGDDLRVKDGSRLDHETNPFHTVKVRVTDIHGWSVEQEFTIRVLDGNGNPPPPPQNHAPNDLVVWAEDVPENALGGYFVGQVLGYDPDGDQLSYRIVNQDSPFVLKGNQIFLREGAVLDYETRPVQIVTIEASDGRGGTLTRSFDIKVKDMPETPPQNHAPEVVLIGGYVPENVPSGSYVGNIDVVDPDGDLVQLELVDDADGRFTLDGHRLLVLNGSKLDYETAMAHDIWVRATDHRGGMTLERLTITVIDVNEDQNPPPENQAPTMLMLDGVQVLENAPTGAVVGYLHGVDPDGDPLTFSLLDDADGRFKIEYNRIVVADGTKLDYETAREHPIRVQVSDGRGGVKEAIFTIHVRDRPDTPPNSHAPIIEDLMGSVVVENAQNGTIVGTVSAYDPDGDPLFYELLDNSDGRFRIENNVIVVADGSRLDYEASHSHSVRVRVTDSHGLSDTRTFAIAVKDVNENPPPPDNHAPIDIILSDDTVVENSDNGTIVGLLIGKDEDAGERLTYSLLDDAGGRFEIVGDELVVKNGAKLDYEIQASHVVTMRVTDSHGLSLVKSFVIHVEDEDDESTQGSDGNDTIVGGAGDDVFFGGLGDDILTGGAGNDSLSGGDGNDRLFGGKGKDVIAGGLGADTLTGGAGKDVFVFDTKPGAGNVDRITDFSVKDDTIHLARTIFKAAGPKGILSKGAFWIGSEAHAAADRIIYNADNGKLYYDADGSGSKAAVQIALLKADLDLKATDFMII
ncbi:cadherin domain-containing protein [Microvirga sp. HBU67558]|uniref:cadherin domain-containing protein n=1 Tax=Microvirga TaxID=186650 RepID=UPI001B39466C|nr:cadherin domain-containing protein [Microvirga sp. HBU67655]MBQ0823387.1 cadherin domain-containing protein [Microvirga sp. HBU67558]